MSIFGVSLARERVLLDRMKAIPVREKDLQEDFVASSGAGGQNVNKVATCVDLLHIPSGIRVKCQKTRQQGLNRFWARVILCERLEKQRRSIQLEKKSRQAKIRREKRKRSPAQKARILDQKRQRSDKKQGRRSIRPHQGLE